MLKNKKNTLSTLRVGDTCIEVKDYDKAQSGTLEITGTGEIKIRNTGGSSASEGGMGIDSDDDKTKGNLTKPGTGKSENVASDDDDITFDPIKKNVRKAEKEQGD